MAYITSHLSQHQAHNSFAQIVSNFLDIWLKTNIIIALHQRKGWCQNCFVGSIELQLFDDWTKLISDLWSTRLILWPLWLGLKEDNYQQLLPKVGEICTKYRFEKKSKTRPTRRIWTCPADPSLELSPTLWGGSVHNSMMETSVQVLGSEFKCLDQSCL